MSNLSKTNRDEIGPTVPSEEYKLPGTKSRMPAGISVKPSQCSLDPDDDFDDDFDEDFDDDFEEDIDEFDDDFDDDDDAEDEEGEPSFDEDFE